MPSILGTIAGGAISKGMDYIDTAVQYYNQKKLNRQAQTDTQQNMRLQKELNLQQQIDSYRGAIVGMRKAGINPAVAVGGVNMAQGVSMAAGNAGAAAKPENSLPLALEAGNALAQQESQIENIKANTDLQKEETREKKIKNDRESSKDSLVSSSFMSNVRAIAESTDNPFIRGFCEDFLAQVESKDFNLGAYEAFNETFFNMSQRERDRELDYKAKEMDKKVLDLQYDNGAAEALADMSKARRLQIYRNVALMGAQIAQLNDETSLTEDKRAAIRASVDNLGQETMSILHHDPAAMWQAGDISSLLVSLGYEGVKAASFGAGMAAGSRFAGAAGKGAANAGTLVKPTYVSPKRMESQPYGKAVPKEILDAIRESARAKANGDKIYEAQLFDASVKRWKAHNGYK